MALSELDRNLLQRCLNRKPQAWEDFVDRFLGLAVHVIHHTARARSIRLSKQDEEDLAAEIFLTIVNNDFAVLRQFRGESSLATYLTVVARRVAVRELLKHKNNATLSDNAEMSAESQSTDGDFEERISDREEVEQLLQRLSGTEADVVRMYHLDGNSYREISTIVGIQENSVGPMLSRARQKLRQAVADS